MRHTFRRPLREPAGISAMFNTNKILKQKLKASMATLYFIERS